MFAQQECSVKNFCFKEGEELKYDVIYDWGPIWIESAYGIFKTELKQYNGKTCYFLSGSGGTYSKYDWFYKVRDNFEVYVDSHSMRPLKFKADIQEGGKNDKHTYLFDDKKKKVYTIITRGKSPLKLDTIDIGTCSIDVLTAIYYARNLDYSKCKLNDTLGISLVVDGKLDPVYVRYKGRAVYTSEELGTFNCVKFTPLLVEGSIFRKGEHMTVWVTDDKNRVPVYIETQIVVGTIKVKLKSYTGLRHPMDARIDKKKE